jgi:hypothetical protein
MGLLNVLQVLKISVQFKLVQNIVMVMGYAIMEYAYALQGMIQNYFVNTPVHAIIIA